MDKERLEKLLGYKVPERITMEEKALIRDTFKGRDELFRIMKKIFLPSAKDENIPIEFQVDLMTEIDFASIPSEQVKPIVLARQYMIKGTLGALMMLKTLANETPETMEELAKRMKKDSTK